jgi:hypothetical protein
MLHEHTPNLFLHTSGKLKEIPLFSRFMRVFWPGVTATDDCVRGIFSDLCKLGSEWIRREIAQFARKIVELGEISPSPASRLQVMNRDMVFLSLWTSC